MARLPGPSSGRAIVAENLLGGLGQNSQFAAILGGAKNDM